MILKLFQPFVCSATWNASRQLEAWQLAMTLSLYNISNTGKLYAKKDFIKKWARLFQLCRSIKKQFSENFVTWCEKHQNFGIFLKTENQSKIIKSHLKTYRRWRRKGFLKKKKTTIDNINNSIIYKKTTTFQPKLESSGLKSKNKWWRWITQ